MLFTITKNVFPIVFKAKNKTNMSTHVNTLRNYCSYYYYCCCCYYIIIYYVIIMKVDECKITGT